MSAADELKRLHEDATPPPWDIVEHSWSDKSIAFYSRTIATSSIADEATEDTQDAIEAQQAAELNLIVLLRNHAADFVKLIEAAEHAVDYGYDPSYRLADALKPFTKE